MSACGTAKIENILTLCSHGIPLISCLKVQMLPPRDCGIA
jgi:hypothetical protein